MGQADRLTERAYKAQYMEPQGEFHLLSPSHFVRPERGIYIPPAAGSDVECLAKSRYAHGGEGPTEYFLMRYHTRYYCVSAKPHQELQQDKKVKIWEEEGKRFAHRIYYDVHFDKYFRNRGRRTEHSDLPITMHEMANPEDPVVIAAFDLLAHSTGVLRDNERIVNICVHEKEPMEIKNWKVIYNV